MDIESKDSTDIRCFSIDEIATRQDSVSYDTELYWKKNDEQKMMHNIQLPKQKSEDTSKQRFNKVKSIPLIPCGCHRCGLMMPTVDRKGRPHRYLPGHGTNYGENNQNWKGENVGIDGLHKWVRPRLPKLLDGACQLCHRTDKPLELACVGKYTRLGDLKANWIWACGSCNQKDPRAIRKRKETTYKRYTQSELNAKISKANTGKTRTLEARAKMSQAKMGPNNPMFGKHHSEETRAKKSQAMMGPKNHMFGKRLSEETKTRISQSQIGSKDY